MTATWPFAAAHPSARPGLQQRLPLQQPVILRPYRWAWAAIRACRPRRLLLLWDYKVHCLLHRMEREDLVDRHLIRSLC